MHDVLRAGARNPFEARHILHHLRLIDTEVLGALGGAHQLGEAVGVQRGLRCWRTSKHPYTWVGYPHDGIKCAPAVGLRVLVGVAVVD